MGKDGVKFVSALLLTVLLSAFVVLSGYERDRRLSSAGRVDIKEINALVEQERLSLREADFYEVIEAAPR